MAEPSLKAGGTGTGLKPVTGPQGLKLAASPFTSAPDEKAAVVDVYDLVKPGVINNGIKEASNLLDDLGGIAGNLGDMAKGAMSSVTDAAKTALDSTKGLQDTIKNAAKAASGAMAVASKAAKAVNAVKNGNMNAAFAGAASLAGMTGMTQVASAVKSMGSTAAMIDRAKRGFDRGGMAGMTNGAMSLASGFGMKDLGNTVRSVSTTINSGMRMADSISSKGVMGGLTSFTGYGGFDSGFSAKRLTDTFNSASQNSRYSLSQSSFDTLKDIDRGLNIASSTISNLGRSASMDFEKGYTRSVSVGNKVNIVNPSMSGSLYSLIDEFDDITSHSGSDNTAAKIGLATGIVSAGIGLGVTDAFSTVAKSGKLDDSSIYLCGVTSSTIAGSAGSFGALADIASHPIGLNAMKTAPKVVKTAAKNFTLDKQDIGLSFSQVWDKIESVGIATGQSLTKTTIASKEMIDAGTISSNPMLAQVASVKAASVQRKKQSLLFSSPNNTGEVDAVSAITAALAAQSVGKSLGMIDAISLGYM